MLKLGYKASSRAFLIGAPDGYMAMVAPLPDDVVFERAATSRTDLVHVFVTERASLAKALTGLRRKLKPDAAKQSRFVLRERAHRYTCHGTNSYPHVGTYAAKSNQLGQKHDCYGHALRMACHKNEICGSHVLDPIEEQFP